MARILVVDDNPDACLVMVKFLRNAGHQAFAATSGGAALAKLKGELPDLVLLDIMMPGLDGETVLRRVRKDPRTRDLKVIAFSAIDDPVYIHHLLAEGADDYWVKGKVEYRDIGTRIAAYVDPVGRAAEGAAGAGL
jgi:CheY-like chemotaxis protein